MTGRLPYRVVVQSGVNHDFTSVFVELTESEFELVRRISEALAGMLEPPMSGPYMVVEPQSSCRELGAKRR